MIPTGTKADGRAVVNVSSPPASSLAAHAGPPTCCAKCQHMNPRGAQVCAQCAHPIVESKRGSRLGARTRRSLRAMRHQARRAALARRLGGVQGCCRNMCRGPVLFVIIFFTLWYGGLCVGFAFVTDYFVTEANSADWPSTPCTYNAGYVSQTSCSDDGSCSYTYKASMTFTVKSQTYTTTICHLATCSSNWSESTATGYGAQFVVGDTYTCWYNPDDPSEAKLSDEVATPVIAFVCYPMFLLFACVPACAMRKTMK